MMMKIKSVGQWYGEIWPRSDHGCMRGSYRSPYSRVPPWLLHHVAEFSVFIYGSGAVGVFYRDYSRLVFPQWEIFQSVSPETP